MLSNPGEHSSEFALRYEFRGDLCSLRDSWLPFGETRVHSEFPGCLLGRLVFTPRFLAAFWGDLCSLRDFWLPFGETCVHSEIPGCLLGANCLSRDHETRQRKHQFYKCHVEINQTKTTKQQTKTHRRLRPLFTLILEVCAHYFVLCGDFLCKTLAFRCPRTLADFTNSNGCILP